ncbi:MAG: RNA polymerase sigma factor (sigma-70 family) [Verrucomicrobiales bacterium]|jgi:RNA polymerase sigma factor (sigma-70 family)
MEIFPATRWSLVLSVREKGAREMRALEELCSSYWVPLYAFGRRQGSSPEDAADLVQGFFLKIIEKDYFADADADRGRLRTFLLAAFKHYIGNEWKKEHAIKRGGNRTIVSIDADEAESVCASIATMETPETAYERQWALTVLRSVIVKLREEYEAADRAETFRVLRPFLSWNEGEGSYAEAAVELQVSENTIKSGVFRLRQRYRKALRHTIADTLKTESDDEIDEELRHLMRALA